MFESARAAWGASAIDRCEMSQAHGPGEASDLLRGGLGGLGLGLNVLEDRAPSAELLLLVGHDFPDSEALLATRGAHLAEAETLYVGQVESGGAGSLVPVGDRAPGLASTWLTRPSPIWRVLPA